MPYSTQPTGQIGQAWGPCCDLIIQLSTASTLLAGRLSARERNRPDQFEIHLSGAIFWPHGVLLATEGMPHLPIRVFKTRSEACSIAQGRREHPCAHLSLVRCFTCSVAFAPPSPARPAHTRNRDHYTPTAEKSAAPHSIYTDVARPSARLLPAASAISLQRRLPLIR